MMMATEGEPTAKEVVVVGSSAGGVEALSVLVGTLPADFPVPIVLAQHLDPTRPSLLSEILQRRTVLPVHLVEERTALQPGQIYLVPSNQHILITDHEVAPDPTHQDRPKPSVDRLLSSAALAYGEHLIAVILTGSGDDGAEGAINVKEAGGVVIIQNPESARHPSMPSSIPPTVVDFSLPLEEIGPTLYDLLMKNLIPSPPSEAVDTVLSYILEMVSQRASIDFRPYKSSTILRRINRCMAITHHATMWDYARFLENHPEEIDQLVQAFLINVTQFFRDPEAFHYLREEILPALIEQARERDLVLRLWSAGCATGEEPYSLAILLAELLGNELPRWSIKIFATDLDEASITFARRGVYTEHLLRDMPNHYRERYFEPAEYGYRIIKGLRQMVIFGQQDLSRSSPFPRIDLVICRNVLIYFTPELQEFVLNHFAFSLGSHNGYLFLGKAETVRPSQSHFELVSKQCKVYQCTSTLLSLPRTLASPRPRARPARRLEEPLPPNPSSASLSSEGSPPERGMEIWQLRRITELFLRFLPTGVVVIDRSYRLLTANSTARRLLGLRDSVQELDFLHAVRGLPYTEVRQAIDNTFRERQAISLQQVELDPANGGNGRYLSLSIALMPLGNDSPDLATISVVDITDQVQNRQQLENAHVEQERLVGELEVANRRLSDMNKELIDANEELQVANEEMMLTHEELQAAMEEFEATNEELETNNEEIQATNEELQTTNEELQTTNEELRARTGELQALTVLLESERARLDEVIQAAPLSILLVQGPRLQIAAFTPHYSRMSAGGIALGQSLHEAHEMIWENGAPLIQSAEAVYEQDAPHTTPPLALLPRRTAADNPTQRYILVPVHAVTGRVNGVVIYGVPPQP